MSVGTGEQAAVEHARHLHVVGEDGAAFGQLDGIDLGLRLVDHGGLGRHQLDRHRTRERLRIAAAGGNLFRLV